MNRPIPNALLLDMDGVLYHGNRALPGAAEFLARIADLRHVFITNNPMRTPSQVADRLEGMGLGRPLDGDILTSAQATADWLSRECPGFRYFAVGGEGLHVALGRAGREDTENADFVVVGEGPGLDYETLTTGVNLVQRGARLVVTNPDTTVDDIKGGRHRVLPGGGALVAPFAVAAGVEPTVIGKPQPLLYEMALARLGVGPESCLMIGDRPDTDIGGAARLGMWTALVRTGRFAPGDPLPQALPRPDWDTADLSELCRVLDVDFPGLLS